MAENILETRILLRYGTYAQWMNSSVILKVGEAAVCAFPQDRIIDNLSNSTPEYTPPAIGIKIGDGYHHFNELPWVQAIAADVYRWAKSANKPTYTAQEIQGLQSYVESLVGSDVEVTIAPRIYQLVQGTGDNANKYYLQYKENNEESPWVLDTSTSIDLNDLVNVVNWITRNNLDEYPNLVTRTAEQIKYFLGTLVNDDSARQHQFVTQIIQTNGIVSAERAQPTFSDIAGTLAVTQGGTGVTRFPEETVLIGNGDGNLLTRPIAESVAANNYLVPNYLMKSYVDTATAGVTGAMHFIGEATVVITPNSSVNPRIVNYEFANAQPGDVILYDAKEFVWTGGSWNLLGDEGSYAVKGSITDADISSDAAINQDKIANLAVTLSTKVDRVEGKTLTSNDFTDELYEKLLNIPNNAQQNTIEHIFLNGAEITPTIVNTLPRSINLLINDFTETERQKLANIESEAQVNKIESISINGVLWPPNENKQVEITIDQAALNLNVLEGAEVRNGSVTEEIQQINKKLQLARIAATGNVQDLKQTQETYIVLDCGTSTTVI